MTDTPVFNERKQSLFRQASFGLAMFERWLLVALLAGMIGIAFVQVVMRNFFDSGLSFADVTVRHLVLWVGLLGASVAAREKRHLSIDIASKFIPIRFGHLLQSFLALITAVCCGMFLWAAVRFAGFMYEFGTGTLEGVWALLACLVLPISFFGIGVRFAVRMVLELRAFFKGVTCGNEAK
ncbi:MAG: TRAP transporter small permease [Deltaproteobacteria bacterium]|nr:TRAP transporter small permease [Deltaproteobacteria bacterium]